MIVQNFNQDMNSALLQHSDTTGLLLAVDDALQNGLYERAGLIENERFQVLIRKLRAWQELSQELLSVVNGEF